MRRKGAVPKSLGAAAFAAVLLTAGTRSLPIIWGRAIVEATDGGLRNAAARRSDRWVILLSVLPEKER